MLYIPLSPKKLTEKVFEFDMVVSVDLILAPHASFFTGNELQHVARLASYKHRVCPPIHP